MHATITRIIASLKDRGHRLTIVRRTMVELFTKATEPLSVPSIIALLSKKKLSVNKTTVYREIEFLEKEGIIIPVYVDAEKKTYELKGNAHHHHVVCRTCDTVEDIDSRALESVMKKLESKVKKNSNFTQIWHSVELFGLCKSCSRS